MNSNPNVAPLSVALFEPRIPQNTGNIARTCAAFKLPLNLIAPLGFSLDSKLLKRAGLDYWPYMDIKVHENFELFLSSLSSTNRLIGFSKSATRELHDIQFKYGDILIFGREDTGLTNNVRNNCLDIASIPMPGGINSDSLAGVRSLNLSSSVAIVLYQACLNLGLLAKKPNKCQ